VLGFCLEHLFKFFRKNNLLVSPVPLNSRPNPNINLCVLHVLSRGAGTMGMGVAVMRVAKAVEGEGNDFF
jgi:hypothetical protein